MRNNVRCSVVRIGLLVSLVIGMAGVVWAQTQTLPPPPPLPPAPITGEALKALWGKMFDAGMITDEQYQYSLKNGRLPADAVVRNSPIPVEHQAAWKGLQDRQVITVEELANVLFKGAIPEWTADEMRALEDLVTVYEPDRRRRLTYAVRRAHQKVELIRLSKQAAKIWKERHDDAVARATGQGLPVKGQTEDGRVFEIHAYDHGGPLYNLTFNRISAQTISTDKAQPGGSSPFQLTGTNVNVAMWDGGVVWTTHQEFASGRVIDMDSATIIDHSTLVAGVLASKGVVSNAQGMACAAKCIAFDWNFLIAEMSGCVVSNASVQISNHSYGFAAGWDNQRHPPFVAPFWWGDTRLSEDEDNHFGWYNADSRTMDDFSYTAPYHLPVFAAGNDRQEVHGIWYQYPLHMICDYANGGNWYNSSRLRPPDGGTNGYDCISSRGVPKNILTVGAVVDIPGGFTNASQVNLESYSSTGPTDDGRIKPDIIANGQSLYTTTTNDTGYKSISGTSSSTPSVAGSLALLQELHARFYGTNAPMLASTLKALALHTADDAGNVGPDYLNGWGLMNTERAAWVITNNAAWNSLPHIKEVSLADGEMVVFGALAQTGMPLKVTICWTDPAGPEQPWALDPTNLTLVNDLDVRVIAPDGLSTNSPWILDPTQPSVAATTGDNFRDNVEQVLVNEPTNGWYTVRVSHKGTLSNGVQDVSILIAGNTPTNGPDVEITQCGAVGSNGWLQLTWPGVVGALYQVESVTNLVTSGWTNRTVTLSANKESMTWRDEQIGSDELRFYRIKRQR